MQRGSDKLNDVINKISCFAQNVIVSFLLRSNVKNKFKHETDEKTVTLVERKQVRQNGVGVYI